MKHTKAVTRCVALAVLAVAMAACTHTGTSGGASIPTSPLQKVAAWNDLAANAIHTVGTTARQLNTAGVLSEDQTRAVVTFTATAATHGQRVTAILTAASSLDQSTVNSVSAEFNAIGADAQALLQNGDLWVKNPNSKAALQPAITLVTSTVQNITLAIQALKQ